MWALFGVEFGHVLCDLSDLFSEGFWFEHADLVSVSEYPPCYFAEAVDAEFGGYGAVAVIDDCLRAVPVYFGDVACDHWQKSQFHVIDSPLGYDCPCPAQIVFKVKVVPADEAFVQNFQLLDAVELEGSNALVHA